MTFFTVPRSQESRLGPFIFEGCSKPYNISYMADTINKSETGMSGQVNCQAVVCKIRSLQRRLGSDTDGFLQFKVELQARLHQLDEERRTPETAWQKRKRAIEDKAMKAFGAELMKTITDNKEHILVFIRLLESDNTGLVNEALQQVAANNENVEKPMQLIQDLFTAQCKLDGLGEAHLLPKLISAFALHGKAVEDYPVMVQTMHDFAMVLSAKDPRGLRWSDATKDRWAWIFRTGGKQLVDNMRGFGFSNASPDDDAGKMHRREKREREGSSPCDTVDMDQGAQGLSNVQDEEPQRKKQLHTARFNEVGPSRRTLQAHQRRVISATKGTDEQDEDNAFTETMQTAAENTETAGILKHEVKSLACLVVEKGSDAGIVTVAFDKLQLAQHHPGDGTTGEGETDCGNLLPGAGPDLAERQANLAKLREGLTLNVNDMDSHPAVVAWFERITTINSQVMPKLAASKAEHQATLQAKENKQRGKCNTMFDTKFESFQEANASTDPRIKAQLNKGRAGRDILVESVHMCDKAKEIFEHVEAKLRRALDMQITDADVQPKVGPHAAYSKEMLMGCVAQLQEGANAYYKGCDRETATHTFVAVVGETNRDQEIRCRAGLVIFVNKKHTPEVIAPGLTALSRCFAEYGYHDAIMHCADGEFAPMYRNDSEGGHTRSCTRYSQYSSCMELASTESRDFLLKRLPELYAEK